MLSRHGRGSTCREKNVIKLPKNLPRKNRRLIKLCSGSGISTATSGRCCGRMTHHALRAGRSPEVSLPALSRGRSREARRPHAHRSPMGLLRFEVALLDKLSGAGSTSALDRLLVEGASELGDLFKLAEQSLEEKSGSSSEGDIGSPSRMRGHPMSISSPTLGAKREPRISTVNPDETGRRQSIDEMSSPIALAKELRHARRQSLDSAVASQVCRAVSSHCPPLSGGQCARSALPLVALSAPLVPLPATS